MGELINFNPEKKPEIEYKVEEAYPPEPDKVGKYFVRAEGDDTFTVSYFPAPEQVNYTTRPATKEELSGIIDSLKSAGYDPGGIL